MSYNFLVVDDTSFMRKMARECLIQHGYHVVGEAVNGKEAVEKFKELEPDVVMMDLTMPEMNGLDAIKEILVYDAEAVILVCSASNQKDLIQEALDAGAVGYLMKPFKPDYMQEIVKRYAEPHLKPLTPEDEEEPKNDVIEEEVVEESVSMVENVNHIPTTEIGPVEVAASIEATAIEQESDQTALAQPVEKRKRSMISKSDKKIQFKTSYMCNWEEEIQGENRAYSFTYTENDNNITIDMMDEQNEKQSIQLTLDGFRELHDWLEQRLEEGKRMNGS
ncbi:response regulator [Pseudalkalibacillus sp. Hm43]|uniref:response regulator n=1 Tax=Pseudalkalibacillus sp. Hm43 TaxID=3450742 RepID=UPI003F4233FE